MLDLSVNCLTRAQGWQPGWQVLQQSLLVWLVHHRTRRRCRLVDLGRQLESPPLGMQEMALH